MDFGEFRRKVAYALGRDHQFDFSLEEEHRLKDIYETVYEDGKQEGYDLGHADGWQQGYDAGYDQI
ncbi:MAG: hypothetical protein J6S67_16850 [Methanobrevibacter sp.]|nr:hypothetical protein [Methanobrevibacter sp.]